MVHKNIIVSGNHGKPILLDIFYKRTGKPKPILIFTHGFKGFKDWGHFDLMANSFAESGFLFVKFNCAFNGTTSKHPADFVDLEAFGNNNYSKELDDLGCVIDYILNRQPYVLEKEMNKAELYLLGHSRGGGISILKAAEDKRVKKIITWASVSKFGQFLPYNEIDEWKNKGVVFTYNSRTKQNMPLYYQLYEDLEQNKERLDIPNLTPSIECPFLIVHGDNDNTVPLDMANELLQWSKNGSLTIIRNGDHTLGGKHPWVETFLPTYTAGAIAASVAFLKKDWKS